MAKFKNVRSDKPISDDELKDQMRGGWVPELPAYIDENDDVIVGARRLRLAKELGIEPVIVRLHIGSGDEADMRRMRLAIASNTGQAPMTINDRRIIAERLYKNQWTQARIAEALGVSRTTIENDLRNLTVDVKLKHAKTRANPKGAGRPKGGGRKQTKAPKPHPKADAIIVRADQGMSFKEIADETGVSARQVRHTVEEEKLIRQGRADPEIDPSTLSKSAQEKLEAAIRQHQKKLDLKFEATLRDRLLRELNEFYLPDFNKQLADAEDVIKSRRGVFTKEEFRLIWSGLHPDRSLSEKKQNAAFNTFKEKELVLLSEKEKPTETLKGFPNSHAEWVAAKQKAAAAKKAKAEAK